MDNEETAKPMSRTDGLLEDLRNSVLKLQNVVKPILVNDLPKEQGDAPTTAESTNLNRQLAEINKSLKTTINKISI